MAFGILSAARKSKDVLPVPKEGKAVVDVKSAATGSHSSSTPTSPPSNASAASQGAIEPPAAISVQASTQSSDSAYSDPGPAPEPLPVPPAASETSHETPKPFAQKRFSFRNLVQTKGAYDRKPGVLSRLGEAAKEATARQEFVEHKILQTRSEKRAHESALVVRELIVGPFAAPSPAAPPKRSKVSITIAAAGAGMGVGLGAAASASPAQRARKVKAELLEPRAAGRVIAQLRQLPSSDVPVVVGKTAAGEEIRALARGPIHAVCLPCADAEAHAKHFARLDRVAATPGPAAASSEALPKVEESGVETTSVVDGIASVTTTSFEKLKAVLEGLDVVSLLTAPDLGLGQPADAPGLLSGALPTAKAVINGVEQITPQLMALGYATGKAVLPSHDGVHPPLDRMSVITYWWGLEVAIPEPSVKFLGNVPSIAHTVVNFLTALSVANGGVRELMPFVRYISQYIDGEFNAIREQDKGQGVVCAATWLMPAALVPRPWDFPPPTSDDAAVPGGGSGDGDGEEGTPAPPAVPTVPKQPGDAPLLLTPPLPSPTVGPLFLSPETVDAAARVGAAPEAVEDDDVPGLTVTPPTPPTSEVLAKAVEGSARVGKAIAVAA